MLALKTMSRPEKLRMMEALWEDLSADAPSLPSPVWHERALEAAHQAHAEGQASFVDWTKAKQSLRRE